MERNPLRNPVVRGVLAALTGFSSAGSTARFVDILPVPPRSSPVASRADGGSPHVVDTRDVSPRHQQPQRNAAGVRDQMGQQVLYQDYSQHIAQRPGAYLARESLADLNRRDQQNVSLIDQNAAQGPQRVFSPPSEKRRQRLNQQGNLASLLATITEKLDLPNRQPTWDGETYFLQAMLDEASALAADLPSRREMQRVSLLDQLDGYLAALKDAANLGDEYPSAADARVSLPSQNGSPPLDGRSEDGANYGFDPGLEPEVKRNLPKPEIEPGTVIVGLKSGEFLLADRLKSFGISIKAISSANVGMMALSVSLGKEAQAKSLLSQEPSVAWADLNPLYYPSEGMSQTEGNDVLAQANGYSGLDPKDIPQWGLQIINAEALWGVEPAVNLVPVKVAIIDSGVALNHPEFISPDGQAVISGDPADRNEHGTAVAGLIFSSHDITGIDGVVNTTIYPITGISYDVFQRESASAWDIANAIVQAVDDGVSVINLSLAGHLPSEAIETALRYAEEHNVLTVISTSNLANFGPYFAGVDGDSVAEPAARVKEIKTILAVGAVALNDGEIQVAQYSGRGPAISLVAPGGKHSATGDPSVEIATTVPICETDPVSGCTDTGYSVKHGTSMAAAYVSGVAAVLRSRLPELSAYQVRDIIIQAAQRLPESGPYGWSSLTGRGLLDATISLALAQRDSQEQVFFDVRDLHGLDQPEIVGETVTIYDRNDQVAMREPFEGDGLGTLNLVADDYTVQVEKPLYVPSSPETISVRTGYPQTLRFFLDSPSLRLPDEVLVWLSGPKFASPDVQVPIRLVNEGDVDLSIQACLRDTLLGSMVINAQNVAALPHMSDPAVAIGNLGLTNAEIFSYDPRLGFEERLQRAIDQDKAANMIVVVEGGAYGFVAPDSYRLLEEIARSGGGIVYAGPYIEQFPQLLQEQMRIASVVDRRYPDVQQDIHIWTPDHPLVSGIPDLNFGGRASMSSRNDWMTLTPDASALAGYTSHLEDDKVAIGVIDRTGTARRVVISSALWEAVLGGGSPRAPIIQLWENLFRFSLCQDVPGMELPQQPLTISANSEGILRLRVDRDLITSSDDLLSHLVLFTNDPKPGRRVIYLPIYRSNRPYVFYQPLILK